MKNHFLLAALTALSLARPAQAGDSLFDQRANEAQQQQKAQEEAEEAAWPARVLAGYEKAIQNFARKHGRITVTATDGDTTEYISHTTSFEYGPANNRVGCEALLYNFAYPFIDISCLDKNLNKTSTRVQLP